jgi:hypothetical protein
MRRWEFYQVANRLKRANHWLQILLILSLILGINHFAIKYFLRHDLSENNRFALSPETRAHLRELLDPIQVVVTISATSPRQEEQVLFRYASQLLQEFAYHSRDKGQFLLTVEHVDIYKDLARADALSREYGVDQINSLLVISGDRKRLIRPDELITFADRKPIAFNGEAALTAAILEVTRETPPKIYFIKGHQEGSPDDPSPREGLSLISRELQMRNFTFAQLDLSTVSAVPEDASVVLLADPKGSLLPSEVNKLRSYLLDRAGRLVVWLRPGVSAGLGQLFAEWGLSLPDQLVIEPDPAYRESTGTLIIRNFGQHPLTDSLISNQTYVTAGLTRPVVPAPPVPADERLHFVPLLASSQSSWAESAYLPAEQPYSFNPGVDLKGPVPVAVAAERRASSQLGIKVPGGRLVVFGAADLFANQRVGSLGNVALFFNTLNWMLDRERMLAIPPRPFETYRLSLSQAQLKQIGLLFLVVPASLALCGFLVYWIRQS